VNAGAFYYIKSRSRTTIWFAICRRAAEQRLLKAENKQLKQEIPAARALRTGEALASRDPSRTC